MATLTDAAGADWQIADLSATINWGDNTTSAGDVGGHGHGGRVHGRGLAHVCRVRGVHLLAGFGVRQGRVQCAVDPTASTTVADASLSLADGAFMFTATEGQACGAGQVATLTDAAGADLQIGDLSATINWGDNTTSAVTLVATGTAGVYTVEGSHTYAEYGPYTIEVSVFHKGGSSVAVGPARPAPAWPTRR